MKRHDVSILAIFVAAGAMPACADDGNHGNVGGGAGSGAAGSGGAGAEAGNGQSGGGTGGGSVVPPDVACGAFAAGNDLNVCTATYLAGPEADEAGGIDLAPDGAVVYGGKLSGQDLGVPATALSGGGSGALVRLSPDGRKVLSITRIGQDVNDVALSASSGNIAVAGDFGVALLDAQGSAALFVANVGTSQRVAVGNDGAVAVLSGKKVSVFSQEGRALGSFDVAGSTVNDLAVDGSGKHVFVTGFKQDDGPPCTQLQIPFVRAYGYDGSIAWRAYDWNHTEVGAQNECADTRGIAVSVGRDGKLYYAGESHGGNSVHRRDPQDISTMTDKTTGIDKYTDPYNMNGAAPVGFYARMNPLTGALENSQRLVVRLPNDKGNAARPTSIAADENGNVLIGGNSACCIPDAAQKTINGLPAFGAYAGGPFVLVVSSTFETRLTWTGFRGTTGDGGDVVGVVAGAGRMAAALTQSFANMVTVDTPLITMDAIGNSPGGGPSDGYAVVWRGP